MNEAAVLQALATTRDQARDRFRQVRRASTALSERLEPEDFVIQSMPETSPPKWHLAHTTWFFETFVLGPSYPSYRVFHDSYCYLFNSYYESVGKRVARDRRGLLSRPSVGKVLDYRAHVDAQIEEFIDRADDAVWDGAWPRLVLGLNHEQQHQELLLMDVRHNLWCNPLYPAYAELERPESTAPPLSWSEFARGACDIGHAGGGFAFDNESPRMTTHLPAFRIANRLVTNGEFLEFVAAGCYADPSVWLADGWGIVQSEGWQAPLYWVREGAQWHQFDLGGLGPVNEHEPVVHVSYFEANAYACWKGVRLPTEFEWERAATDGPIAGNFLERGLLHPTAATPGAHGPTQMFGDVWEWTQSAYAPYPGFRPLAGGLGEYNGKFMINQLVQRGGSCLTPRDHVRASYRNFFYPHQRWNTQGFRLADDLPD